MIRSTPILWFSEDIDSIVDFYTDALGDVQEVTRMHYPDHSEFVDMEPSLSKKLLAVFLRVNGAPLTIARGRSDFLREEHVTFTLNFQCVPAADVAAAMHKTWAKLSDGGTVVEELTEYEGGRIHGRVIDRYGIRWSFLNAMPGEVVEQFLITNLIFTEENQNQAAQALDFYVDSFSETRKGDVFTFPEADDIVTTESIMYSEFMIHDTYVIVRDAGYAMPAQSGMSVMFGMFCDTQEELDQLWNHFAPTGTPYGHFGIVADQFGFNWLIAPFFVWKNCEDGTFLDSFFRATKADFAELDALSTPELTRSPIYP
ncbi:MAG: VOC family protein [Corynebacterium sp.]|nr:VOC family protein [Corynebacterium sp.]